MDMGCLARSCVGCLRVGFVGVGRVVGLVGLALGLAVGFVLWELGVDLFGEDARSQRQLDNGCRRGMSVHYIWGQSVLIIHV